MDNHNPHLELTLSTRKKISSVLEHLNRKWGNSSVASGELMLFPYSVQRENLVGHQRWIQDSVFSAADVYAMIGNPPLFRLRYGWFSDAELGYATLQAPSTSSCVEQIVDALSICEPSTIEQSENYVDPYNKLTSAKDNHAFAPSLSNVPNEMSRYISTSKGNIGETCDPAANVSWPRKETGNKIVTGQVEDVGDERLSSGIALSAGEWADSLTNVSIGDLLSEVPHDGDAPPNAESSQCLQQIPFNCDSFDAAIAAHISRHQNKMGALSTLASHASPIWDAEETCDAFSFQKHPVLCHEVSRFPAVAPLPDCKQIVRTHSVGSGGIVEELPDVEGPTDYPAHEDPLDECLRSPHNVDNSTKDFNVLADIYWPESLGPLDLDIPSFKYCGEDIILSDSIGGLSRLIASSLDAFQNCSFFGLDKKEPTPTPTPTPTVEARESASLSDFKIGSQG